MNEETNLIGLPDPETIKALIELGLKPAEPSSDPVIVETPTNVLRLSEVPEQDQITNDGLVHDDPSVDLAQPDLSQPDLSQPDLSQPDLSQPDLSQLQVAVEGASPEPQLCAPEEFPLTLDCGVIPWSKIPIAEISPLVWFKYDKFEGTDSTVFNVSDGNGRMLFHCCEEEVAKFFVTAANLYVQAGMQTQTQV